MRKTEFFSLNANIFFLTFPAFTGPSADVENTRNKKERRIHGEKHCFSVQLKDYKDSAQIFIVGGGESYNKLQKQFLYKLGICFKQKKITKIPYGSHHSKIHFKIKHLS